MAQVSKTVGIPKLTHCLPLAKAPFRFRAPRFNGVIGPIYPDLTDPAARARSFDGLLETLRYSLPGWIVERSTDGFGFDFVHRTWGGLHDVNPVAVLSGHMRLPERVEKTVIRPLEHIWRYMVMEFGWAVEAGYCEIWARVRDDTADHQKIPSSTWSVVEIKDWSRGQAETEAGVLLYDIQVCPAQDKVRRQSVNGLTKSSDRLPPAEESSSPTKRSGGRPPAVDWPTVEHKLFELMAHHGDFSSGDQEWNAQARLEEELLEFCRRKFGKEPAVSTLRTRLSAVLQRWQDSRSKT